MRILLNMPYAKLERRSPDEQFEVATRMPLHHQSVQHAASIPPRWKEVRDERAVRSAL
jgi:hypothetical protein